MSDAISFRPMTAADIDAVLKIEYAAFSHPWTRGIFTDSLTSYNCWVMFEGEQQVGHGVIQIIMDEAHLLNITVKAESQGRGLGLKLLEQRTDHHQGIFAAANGRVVVAAPADFIKAVTLVQAVGHLVARSHFQKAVIGALLLGLLHQVLEQLEA